MYAVIRQSDSNVKESTINQEHTTNPHKDTSRTYGSNPHRDTCRKSPASQHRRKRRKRMRRLWAAAFSALIVLMVYSGFYLIHVSVLHRNGLSDRQGTTLSAVSQTPPSKGSSTKNTASQHLTENDSLQSETSGTKHLSADENLILVNSSHCVPEQYSIELTILRNGVQVDSRIYPALQQMFDDMRAQGIYPIVGEGYRTHAQQEQMMEEKIEAYRAEGHSLSSAKKMAQKWVAEPGTSEHELGIALDINADPDSATSNDTVYQWLASHAHSYGFILRYPQGKEDITGIDYEPWHYRYVGKYAAEEIYKQQITLEEYLNETQ